jgi:hypothetical protein
LDRTVNKNVDESLEIHIMNKMESIELCNSVSSLIVSRVGPLAGRITLAQIKELEQTEQYRELEAQLLVFLKENCSQKPDPNVFNSELEDFKKLFEEVRAEQSLTKLTSTLGLATTAIAALSAFVFPLHAVLAICGVGAGSTLFGWLNRIAKELEIKKYAGQISTGIVRRLEPIDQQV